MRNNPNCANLSLISEIKLTILYYFRLVVITNCHPTVHTWSLHPAKDWNIEDRSWFDKLEEQVLMWMGNVNLTAEIFYLPLLMVTPTSRVLLIPTYHPYTL